MLVKIKSPSNLKCSSKKEKKFIIFLDMDGCCTNWLKGACELFDFDINEKEFRNQLSTGIDLDKTGRISGKELWDKIDKAGTDFWSKLDILPWAKKLIEEMEKLGEVYFLTSPGTCVPAPSGKMEWVNKYFPKMIERLIICKNKEMCANKNAVLVDDSEKKVEKFREAGGHAFLWPNNLKLEDEGNSDGIIDKLVKEVKGYINGQD